MTSSRISRRDSTTIPTLSKQVQNIIPKCAQPCLAAYLSQESNVAVTCPDGELSCVCARYSFHGFTLGELALTCLHISDCGSESLGDLQDQLVYGICSNQDLAVQATHTIISPPATTPIGAPRTTPAGGRTTTQSTAFTATAPKYSSSMSLQPSSSSSLTAVPNTTPRTISGTQGLTSEQAIGISIGVVAFVVIALAFAYILVCFRRRKSREVDSTPTKDSTNDKPFHRSWFNLLASRGHHNDPVNEKRQTTWPSPHLQPEYCQTGEKAAGARTSMSQESIRSTGSNRTVSRLLPEKPLRVAQRPGRQSVEPLFVQTPATVFEEDRFSIVPQPIPSLPKNPRQPQYAHQFTRTAQAEPQPSLSLTIPQQGAHPKPIEAVGIAPPRDNKSRPFYKSSKSASSDNSFLNYYEGPDSGSPEDFYPYTSVDEHMQIRRPAPAAITIRKPIYPPVAVRTSMASDTSRRTSFESTDPDEPTPPDEADEEDKRLTPVAESPIASIRYPKIPRGSNQVVPRSPPQQKYNRGEQQRQASSVARGQPTTPSHAPSLSGSTLAAKRLGDHAAHNLQRGLHITNGTPPREHRQQPGENGKFSRNGSPANWPLPSHETIKSTLWEPKLTPRRMGGDLYLSVSVATPQHAQFSER